MEPGWLTGTTVLVAPRGAVGGVDVRGGSPGTRETDLLVPSAMMQTVHALVLTGGSAFGLSAADGVMAGLEERGIGFPIRTPQAVPPEAVVPIVPAAVIFDLGRGGDHRHRPDAGFGARALDEAMAAHEAGAGSDWRTDTGWAPAMGSVGAGAGAVCGGLRGGFGYAERRVPSTGAIHGARDARNVGPGSPREAPEWRVGAAMVVNPVGSAVDEQGRLWARDVLPADDPRRHLAPSPEQVAALAAQRARHTPSLNTCIGVVTTDAPLAKVEARKVAEVGHDGLARAIRPVHSMADGDTIFCLAAGTAAQPDDPVARFTMFDALLSAAADAVAHACAEAVWSATSAGDWLSYADIVDPDASRQGRASGPERKG